MIDKHFAQKFTSDWIAAWNSHNLGEILSHYTDDFVLESPLAAQRVPESKGTLYGKEQVRPYWKMGLEVIPDLFFEVHELLLGVNGLTIYYLNRATGRKAAEVFMFNEQMKVVKSFVYYGEV
jgi:ketosteroid isomerase-like protein